MKNQQRKQFIKEPKVNSNERVGVRTDLESDHPLDSTDRYAGDSVNEHKAIERANEHFAEKEIEQVNNNL